MLLQIILFVILLLFIFILSLKLTKLVYDLVFIITANHKVALGFLIVLILPGTIIHELSHFIIATLLRVPTGKLTVFPTVDENGEIKAGQLTLGATDPFRMSIVGLAPIFSGLFIIYIVGEIFFNSPSQFLILNSKFLILNFFGFYFLFATTLTMFSSRKDMESLIIVVPILTAAIFSLYKIGVRIFLENSLMEKIYSFLKEVNTSLIIGVAIDFAIFILFAGILLLLQKILNRKIVRGK